MTDNVTNLLAAVDPADERAITRFLFEEVQVLDDWQFAKWLDFFHDDTMYWAPTQTDRYPRERAKRISAFGTSVYFEENKVQLKQRVDRLLTDQPGARHPPRRGPATWSPMSGSAPARRRANSRSSRTSSRIVRWASDPRT